MEDQGHEGRKGELSILGTFETIIITTDLTATAVVIYKNILRCTLLQ